MTGLEQIPVLHLWYQEEKSIKMESYSVVFLIKQSPLFMDYQTNWPYQLRALTYVSPILIMDQSIAFKVFGMTSF